MDIKIAGRDEHEIKRMDRGYQVGIAIHTVIRGDTAQDGDKRHSP